MKTKTITKLLTCTVLWLLVLSTSLLAQTLTSDQTDYAPGSVATLTGSGFQAGETVTLQVVHADDPSQNSEEPTHQPWDVEADGDGNFVATWDVNDDGDQIGATLLATADGQSSGLHAEVTFTDDIEAGTGVVTVSSNDAGSCFAYTPGNGGTDNYEVIEGGSYTITISGVTECTGDSIKVFVFNSQTGNWCFNIPAVGAGTYSGSFTMHSPTCFTSPIAYKCDAGSNCSSIQHQIVYRAFGLNGGAAHFRANTWTNCTNPVVDDFCTANNCPPLTVGITSSGSLCLCEGECVLLGAHGAPNFTWSTGETTNTITVCESGVYTVTGSNNCPSYGSASITVTVLTAPVFDNCTDGTTELGCDPTPPSCEDVTAHNECDPVEVICTPGTIQSDGCNRSQDFVYTATACSLTSTCTRSYTWTVSTEATIEAEGPVSVCEGTCVTIHVTSPSDFNDGMYQWYHNGILIPEETGSSIFACETGEYYVVASNLCGCGSTSNAITVTVNDVPSCNLDPIAEVDLPVANTDNNVLCATTSGGNNNTYEWTLTSSDNSWYIQSGGDQECVTFHCGTFGSSASFTFVVTAHYGDLSCEGDQCGISISPEAHEQCAYTQGFYGQSNGQTSCTSMPAPQAVNQALQTTNAGVYVANSCNPIVLGNPGNNKKITIGCTEASCVTQKLPAGSSAASLGNGPAGGWTCTSYTGGNLLQNGKFKNVLIGQTLTLAINTRLYPGLLGLHLTTTTFVTYASSDCNPATAQIVPNSQITFNIPQSVINCLGSNSNTNKVSNLLALANKALGGQALGCACSGNCAPTLSEINAAVTAVNEGFDRCRIISGFNIKEEASTTGADNFGFVSYPNPSTGETTITFVAPADGNATIVVYNLNGSLVNTLFNNGVNGGTGYNVEFNTSSWDAGIYFIRTTIGDASAFGKLVIVKQ